MKFTTFLPEVLSQEEVLHFIKTMSNLKHKAYIVLLYSAGLRVSELRHLRYEDVDRKNLRIYIRNSKSRSDRYAILSKNALKILTDYWYRYGRPKEWLFPGAKPNKPVASYTINRLIKQHASLLGVEANVTPHLFRHCPCCQGVVKAKWIDKRKSEVLNAPYFHVVFTVPSELRPLFFSNKNELYSLLYQISKETLMTLAKDPKYLGVDIGFMSILHTFGQNLSYHPHLHCVVLGGGLTKDLKFKKSDDKFLFPVRVISKLFRGKFLAALKELYKNKKLIFSSEMKGLCNSKAFNDFLSLLYSKEWIPHIKETFKGAKNVAAKKYTNGVKISFLFR
ncbi:MAG: transposase [Alkaliphilus sp.]